jgi:hypothetical protein
MATILETLDRLLDKGVVVSNEDNKLCCPSCVFPPAPAEPIGSVYVFASVETALKLWEGVDGLCHCCTHIKASIETSLKFSEASTCDDNNLPNPQPICPDDFQHAINELTSGFSAVQLDLILDAGMVEIGANENTNVTFVKDFLESALNIDFSVNNTNVHELLLRILNKGIAVYCHDDEMYIGSVETVLKAIEGTSAPAPVPA